MKQKILFPFVGDSVGGSHISAITLMAELQSRGTEVVAIIHRNYEPLEKLFIQNNIPYELCHIKKLAGQSPSFFSIFGLMIMNFIPLIFLLHKYKPTIVHGNDLRTNLTWGIPSKAYRAKFIWHQRTILSKSKLWHFIDTFSSHCIAISNFVFQSLPSNLKNSKKSMIYNPVSFNNISNESSSNLKRKLGFKQDTIVLVYAGRLVPTKGIDTLILTLKNLLGQPMKFELLLVGKSKDHYQEYLESIAMKLGVKNQVHFFGYVPNPEEFIAMADFVISPGSLEGLGRLAIEGMLHKTMVLASDSGAHKEIIQSGQNGILFPARDHLDIAKKIQYFVINIEERTKIVHEAYNTAKQKFSVENHCNQMQQIYNINLKN